VDAGAAAAIEVRLHFRGDLTEFRLLGRRDPFDAELRRAHQFDFGYRDVARLQLRAEPLHFGLALNPEGIVGLDAKDQVDASLEIEAELQLLLFEPTGRRQVFPRGEDRIDPQAREDNQNDGDRDDFPANVLHNVPGRKSCLRLLLSGLDDRRLALITTDSRLCDLYADFIGNLQLHLLLIDFHNPAVDSAGRDHTVVHFQAVEEFLHFLLFPLHREQDDEIEDAEDENEWYELEPGTATIRRCTQREDESHRQHFISVVS
jgi:hypothetical protein